MKKEIHNPTYKNRKKASMFPMLAFITLLIINIPILAIISTVRFDSNPNWDHVKQYLLLDAVSNTAILVLFTMLLTGTLGVVLAVTVVRYDFPLKHVLEKLLFLPLAIPPYIAAYIYAGMLSYTGTVQRLARHYSIPVPNEWLDIMNIPGAILIYSITLYPYVYGAVKTFLEHHSTHLIDTAKVLGYSRVQLSIKIILPLIRIPLIGGLMMVMMEVVNDFGVVSYFNIPTVSAVIFESWFGLGATDVAIRISFYVLMSILVIIIIEEILRGRKKYSIGSGRATPIMPRKLYGFKGVAVTCGLLLSLAVSFLIPICQLIAWASLAWDKVYLPDLARIIGNTLYYSTIATSIILLVNIWISHSRRWMTMKSGFLLSKLILLGYSIPGAIIAIGTLMLFVYVDNLMNPLYRYFDLTDKKLLLSTSVVMLVFAYVVRYMAVGFNSVHSGFAKIGVTYNEAARLLGLGRTKAMLRIELPMLKNALLAGFILTLVDLVKELPLTLLLRPFNYNTLASRVYEYANDERIHEASVPALILISLSALAILWLTRFNSKKGRVTS